MPNPSAEEQLILELINRVRIAPGQEAALLANAQANIDSAVNFFGVDLAAFAQQMAAYDAVHPVAWNSQLADAADFHSGKMIEYDVQSHRIVSGDYTEPALGERASNAGYNFSTLAENIFAFSQDPLYGHAGFVIDWGYDTEDYDNGQLRSNYAELGDGMQDPPGHRITIMSANYDEVGIGVLFDTDPATQVGPQVTTHVFGSRFDYQAQFVGSVINDTDNDDFYDIGEGMGGVTVTARNTGNGATYTTTTWDSGGYQLVAPAGTYTLTFSGGGLNAPVLVSATIAGENVYVSAENPSGANGPAAHDYTADGLSDILWRHADGTLTYWAATGTGFNGATGFVAAVGTQWQVVGDGDFTNDGLTDLLWRSDSGQITFWAGTGSGFNGATGFVETVSTDWSVAGSGDFTGDGIDDILWRNDNGALTVWNGTGSGFNGAGFPVEFVGTDWQVADTGDFDGDGIEDLLWRNDNGALTFWTGTGSGFDGGKPTEFVGTDWQVAGTGDFNGDGRDDILWRNDNGALTVWTSNGSAFDGTSGFYNVIGNEWSVAETGDYDGDGFDDVLWRSDSGGLTYWSSTGSSFDGATGFFASIDTQWDVLDL